MLLGVAYEFLSPVILILYSFSPPRGTTELDLGGRRSRLDVHEDGDASICSLLTHDEPMLTCNPCSLATHEGAQEPMPMKRAMPRSAHFEHMSNPRSRVIHAQLPPMRARQCQCQSLDPPK